MPPPPPATDHKEEEADVCASACCGAGLGSKGVAATFNTGGPSASDISKAQANFKENPQAAQASFKSSSKLVTGLRSVARVGRHTLHIDEPTLLGGDDTGPNPVEYVLAALGTCQEITYKAYAIALGIPLRSVRAEVTGQLDLRGFFAVSPYEEARPGFSAVQTKVYLDTDAPDEKVELLKNLVDKFCPVKDILENATPVQIEVSTVNSTGQVDQGGPSAKDISALQAAFKSHPAQAQASFKSSSKLAYGLHSVVRLGRHTVHVDEPEVLGGDDTGPNPVEIVLAALGTCHEITFKAYANALGIPLRSVKAEVTGQLDLRGFYGVSEYAEARPGFSAVQAKIVLDTSAPADVIEQLKAVVATHCPVKDILEKPVPVTFSAERASYSNPQKSETVLEAKSNWAVNTLLPAAAVAAVGFAFAAVRFRNAGQ